MCAMAFEPLQSSKNLHETTIYISSILVVNFRSRWTTLRMHDVDLNMVRNNWLMFITDRSSGEAQNGLSCTAKRSRDLEQKRLAELELTRNEMRDKSCQREGKWHPQRGLKPKWDGRGFLTFSKDWVAHKRIPSCNSAKIHQHFY